MPIPTLKVAQGTDQDYSWQTPNNDGTYGGQFVSTDTIASKVWSGDSEAVLAAPAVVWGGRLKGATVAPAAGAPISLWTIQLRAADTAGLAPGQYRCQVFGTHLGRTGRLWDGLLDVVETPGTTVDTDLASFTYVETLLAPLKLNRDERAMITSLKAEASQAIVKHCDQRDFIRQTYTEEYTAGLNGYCALRQMPVNNVLRIRGYPQVVLTITGSNSTMQQAWVSYSTSGDWYTNTLVFTGLVLTSVNNGVQTVTPLLFATHPTVGQLAAAVAAIAGWTANTTPVYSLYPSTDLSPPGGVTAQGALDEDGVELSAYTEDLTCTRIDNAAGMLWVGRRGPGSYYGFGDGYDWNQLDQADGPIGRVQVTYDAGFSVVPAPIQLTVAELVQSTILKLRKNPWLKKEDNGVYSYEITEKDIGDMPYSSRCRLAKWKIRRAR